MGRTWSWLLAVIVVAIGLPSTSHAQAAQADPAAASRGRHVYDSRQCRGCHDFGRQQSTGPDLVGVTDRRSPEWLRAWLKDPSRPEDPTARALRAQYGLQMPNFDLTDQQINDLIAFMAEQTQLHAKK